VIPVRQSGLQHPDPVLGKRRLGASGYPHATMNHVRAAGWLGLLSSYCEAVDEMSIEVPALLGLAVESE
jgi:hypothetical protein